uniref:TOXIN FS2 n=1 Tax=Dendroaspis polylepis polylepis TaxID=8620 RepID=UPI0000112DA6|nr:Chain A, TOXIN FS2 [Dendroaspis polylepis polylepis]
RICYSHKASLPRATKTCVENTCYKMFIRTHREYISERGCGCPTAMWPYQTECCKGDRCNK